MEICSEKKWQNHQYNENPNKKKPRSSVGHGLQVDTDDDASSVKEGKRTPTPNSVATKRPSGKNKGKEKLKK